jgi:hypothetical protein
MELVEVVFDVGTRDFRRNNDRQFRQARQNKKRGGFRLQAAGDAPWG